MYKCEENDNHFIYNSYLNNKSIYKLKLFKIKLIFKLIYIYIYNIFYIIYNTN